jgi:hypothetical protein
MEQIILWEIRGEIIRACELAVHQALRELKLTATVSVNSEGPLIGRNQLWGRLPVLEIRGLYLSLRPGIAFTSGELRSLFSKVFADRLGCEPGSKLLDLDG